MDAQEMVDAVANDPAGRLALAEDFYAAEPATIAFGRGQEAFMRWSIVRGALDPPDGNPPGSPWWRAVNARLLLDQTEARLTRKDGGTASRPEVQHWIDFMDQPSSISWYLAHNASVVTGYVEHANAAADEPGSEQWFINLVLVRVLYAQAAEDGALAKTTLDDLASALAEPTGSGVGDAMRLRDFYPATYPAPAHHAWWAACDWDRLAEWFVDRHVVLPRTTELFHHGASILGIDSLRALVHNDVPCYPWPLLASTASGHEQGWFHHAVNLLKRHPSAPKEDRPVPPTPQADIDAEAARVLAQQAHRPWPAPTRHWLAYQRWEHILFLHWAVDPALLRPLVPAELEIDTFADKAYLALVPLKMADVHLHHLPPVGRVSNFPELNFRTYVTYKGRPGVYFFTLDAASRFDVWVGRHVFHLNYEAAKADIGQPPHDDFLTFDSTRDIGWEGASPGSKPARLTVRYRPKGAGAPPTKGSLEEFLCERYLMFTHNEHNQMLSGEIHHLPWQLFAVDVDLTANTVPQGLGITLPAAPDSALYSPVMVNFAWSMSHA